MKLLFVSGYHNVVYSCSSIRNAKLKLLCVKHWKLFMYRHDLKNDSNFKLKCRVLLTINLLKAIKSILWPPLIYANTSSRVLFLKYRRC